MYSRLFIIDTQRSCILHAISIIFSISPISSLIEKLHLTGPSTRSQVKLKMLYISLLIPSYVSQIWVPLTTELIIKWAKQTRREHFNSGVCLDSYIKIRLPANLFGKGLLELNQFTNGRKNIHSLDDLKSDAKKILIVNGEVNQMLSEFRFEKS